MFRPGTLQTKKTGTGAFARLTGRGLICVLPHPPTTGQAGAHGRAPARQDPLVVGESDPPCLLADAIGVPHECMRGCRQSD